jgi:hypothetical protein
MDKEILEYNKYINRLVIIRNISTLICFTILAIVFNKWWLVLLSILFLSSMEREKE